MKAHQLESYTWKTNENYNLLCPNKLKHIKKMTQDMKQHKL